MSAVNPPATDIRPVPRRGMKAVFTDAAIMAKRSLITIPRIPEALIFATIQPVLFVLLFRYVFGGSIVVPGYENYVDFLMPGIFVQTITFGSVATGIGLADDLQKGLIDRFRSLPMARSAVLSGRTLADLVRNTFVVVIMALVGLLVGFRPQGEPLGWVAAAGILLLISFSFSWVGAWIGLKVRTVEVAQSAGFIWLFPLTFASSAFVDPRFMTPWLRRFAENQPISLAIDAVRGLLTDSPQPIGNDGWLALAWFGGITILFMFLATRLFRRTWTR